MKKCNKCLCELGARNRSGYCRKCYIQNKVDALKKPDTYCDECNALLPRRARKSKCRYHNMLDYNSISENIIRKKQISKNWAKNNPEKHRNKSLIWQKNNPLKTVETRKKTVRGIVNRFTRAKHRAIKRGFEWAISREEYSLLLSQKCTYCEGSLNESGVGLDRKDSARGYEIENLVACCRDCNVIKSDILSFTEMKAAMNAVLELRKKNIS